MYCPELWNFDHCQLQIFKMCIHLPNTYSNPWKRVLLKRDCDTKNQGIVALNLSQLIIWVWHLVTQDFENINFFHYMPYLKRIPAYPVVIPAAEEGVTIKTGVLVGGPMNSSIKSSPTHYSGIRLNHLKMLFWKKWFRISKIHSCSHNAYPKSAEVLLLTTEVLFGGPMDHGNRSSQIHYKGMKMIYPKIWHLSKLPYTFLFLSQEEDFQIIHTAALLQIHHLISYINKYHYFLPSIKALSME